MRVFVQLLLPLTLALNIGELLAEWFEVTHPGEVQKLLGSFRLSLLRFLLVHRFKDTSFSDTKT